MGTGETQRVTPSEERGLRFFLTLQTAPPYGAMTASAGVVGRSTFLQPRPTDETSENRQAGKNDGL